MVIQAKTYNGLLLLKQIKQIINQSETVLNITTIRNELKYQYDVDIPVARLGGFLDCAGALGRVVVIRPTVNTTIITNSTMLDKHIKTQTVVGKIFESENTKRKKDKQQSSFSEY